MLNNPDRRRSRESPEELNPPSKIQATSSRPRPLSLSQPSFSSSSSARSPPTASTNYHSLINRFISFLPQSSSRGELTSSSDRLSPSISNHEGTSSILVPLYAALKYSPPPPPQIRNWLGEKSGRENKWYDCVVRHQYGLVHTQSCIIFHATFCYNYFLQPHDLRTHTQA